MGSYLEAYGAGEAERARRALLIKRTVIAVVAATIIGLVLYMEFRFHAQQSTVSRFLGLLKTRDYSTAYGMFGCSEAHPCRDYAYPKFMEDWGPQSQFADPSKASLGITQSCGNGVLIQVNYPGKDPTALIVDTDNGQISFAPWPECPGRHWHFRQWWHSLFSRS